MRLGPQEKYPKDAVLTVKHLQRFILFFFECPLTLLLHVSRYRALAGSVASTQAMGP